MALIDYLTNAFQSRLQGLASFDSPFSLASLAGALGIIGWLFLRRRRSAPKKPGMRAFLRSAFPGHIIQHASTRLDLVMFVANAILLGGAYSLMVVARDRKSVV